MSQYAIARQPLDELSPNHPGSADYKHSHAITT